MGSEAPDFIFTIFLYTIIQTFILWDKKFFRNICILHIFLYNNKIESTQTVVYDPFNAFYCYTMPNIFLSKLSPSQHAYVKYTTAIKLLQKEKIKLDNKIKAAQEEFFKFHEDNDGYLKFLN